MPSLSLRVACARGEQGHSFVAAQYATYPFRLSGNLRLDPSDRQRVYAYMMNASPGILSGDDLRLAVQVGDRYPRQPAQKLPALPAKLRPPVQRSAAAARDPKVMFR